LSCLKLNIPVVTALGVARRVNANLLTVTTLNKTHTCPLARMLRNRVKKAGYSLKIPCIFSPEQPKAEQLDGILIKDGQKFLGSYMPVVMQAGLLAANWVLQQVVD
jgi:tRNA A37 threonylcarbamoyladenosine dehydratase